MSAEVSLRAVFHARDAVIFARADRDRDTMSTPALHARMRADKVAARAFNR
jgi:hypothetical protein